MEVSVIGIRDLFTLSFGHCSMEFEQSYKLREHDFSFPPWDQKRAVFLIFHYLCKARRQVNLQSKWKSFSPERVHIHGWKSNCALYSHHYNRATRLGYSCTRCTEQTWDLLNKLKVSKKKQELVIYSRASKATYESTKERKGISQHSESNPFTPWKSHLRKKKRAFGKEVFKHKYIYQACLGGKGKKQTKILDSR